MRTTRAFTLVEVILVMAILTIVFTIGALTWPRQDMALTQATNNLASTIRYARFEAIKRNTSVRVDLTQNTSELTVLLDADGTPLRTSTLDVNDTPRVTITSPTTSITFNARGIATRTGNTNVTLAYTGANNTRAITITQQGVIRR